MRYPITQVAYFKGDGDPSVADLKALYEALPQHLVVDESASGVVFRALETVKEDVSSLWSIKPVVLTSKEPARSGHRLYVPHPDPKDSVASRSKVYAKSKELTGRSVTKE